MFLADSYPYRAVSAVPMPLAVPAPLLTCQGSTASKLCPYWHVRAVPLADCPYVEVCSYCSFFLEFYLYCSSICFGFAPPVLKLWGFIPTVPVFQQADFPCRCDWTSWRWQFPSLFLKLFRLLAMSAFSAVHSILQ